MTKIIQEERNDHLPHPIAECIGIMPDEDAEEMIKIIEEEFEQVDLDQWESIEIQPS